MPSFNYQARDTAGNMTDGSVKARDRTEAMNKLRTNGLWIMKLQGQAISETSTKTFKHRFGMWDLLPFLLPGPRHLALFFKSVATMFRAGVTLHEAMQTIGKNASHRMLRSFAQKSTPQLMQGKPWSQQLRTHRHIFPAFATAIVETGEKAGSLDRMLESLASNYQRDFESEQQFKRQLFIPKALVMFLICYVVIVPLMIGSIIGQIPGGDNLASQAAQSGLDVMRSSVLSLVKTLFILGVLWIAYRMMKKVPNCAYFFDRIWRAVPGPAGITRRISEARFCRALATLYSAGVNLPTALLQAGQASGSPTLERATLNLEPQILEGKQLSDTLSQSGLLNSTTLQMITTGEKTGNLDEVLDKTADYYDDEAQTALKGFAIILGIIVLVGALVFGAIIIAKFYLTYYGSLIHGL